jgi:hypothetical protein
MFSTQYSGKFARVYQKKRFRSYFNVSFSVKQVAYSTYTDVKHRSYNLLMHNIEKVKRLDIYIDIQSSYFLLPENGVYQQ